MILKDSGSEDLMQNTLEKTIDENSKDLMFKVLQSHQYRYPIKSAIRETASNGVDSHNERDMARKILSGEAQVSDYYEVEKSEKGMQHSSSFDPDYYDLKWLSTQDKVTITYIERDENRDLIRFEDWGVGLGGARMEGFFSLAYSTKRKNKKLIGGWGLGAKAFLATDIDSFRVTSYYNGKKFIFDVYETTVNSVVPKFSDAGNKNEIYTFPKSGYQCYFESTTRKNGVVVEATVVKSQKYDYQRAVKTQLLYMSKVEFRVHNSWGRDYLEDFQASVLYSDENIMISSNNVQSKPHILMGDPELGTLINYGYVDFEALEMPQYYGSVGIIVGPDEVDISTSRENLLWKKKTREGIQKKFDLVRDTAEKYVKDKISIAEHNLFLWLEASHSIISSSKNHYSNNKGDDVLYQLAKVVDIDQISFEKAGDSSKNFVYSPVTKYFKSKENVLISRHITKGAVNYTYRDNVGVAKRVGVTSWGSLFNSTIYLVEEGEKITGAAIRYLMKKHNDDVCFINTKGYELNKHLEPFVKAAIEVDKISLFSELEIPEEELNNFNQLEEAVGLSIAEKRKLEGKVVLKEVINGNYADSVEYTREEITGLVGIYGESSAVESLKSIKGLSSGYSVYAVSEQVAKIIEETDTKLTYYKDSVFTVEDGAITFHLSGVNDYIKYRISSKVNSYTSHNLSENTIIEAKHLGFTNIGVLAAYYKELTRIGTALNYNRYADIGYAYGEFFSEFSLYLKDLINTHINQETGYNLTSSNRKNLPKSIDHVHTLADFDDRIKELKTFKRLNSIMRQNSNFLQAFRNDLITLEQLNSLIDLKLIK